MKGITKKDAIGRITIRNWEGNYKNSDEQKKRCRTKKKDKKRHRTLDTGQQKNEWLLSERLPPSTNKSSFNMIF